MKSASEYLQILSNFKTEFGKEYGITRIGIFGSVARGEQTPSSDLDVCIELTNISLETIYSVKERLEQLCQCKIDLVRYRNSLRPSLLSNINKDIIYA